MKKKIIAIIAEIIPVVSAAVSVALVFLPYDTALGKKVTSVTFALAFLGFVFFFIGRALAKEDKAVRVLGIFDLLATLSVIVIYVLAIFSFGL